MSHMFSCERAVAPGIVVPLLNASDMQRLTWGVTIPYKYWRQHSRSDVVGRFERYSHRGTQIPVLEFSNAETWKLGFVEFHCGLGGSINPLCWIDVFLAVGGGPQKKYLAPLMLWACSHRDGSRYNRELLAHLQFLARGVSKDFTEEELKKEEQVGVHESISYARAIREWRAEHPNWQTHYEHHHPLPQA